MLDLINYDWMTLSVVVLIFVALVVGFVLLRKPKKQIEASVLRDVTPDAQTQVAAPPAPEPQAAPTVEEEPLADLGQALQKTKSSFLDRLKSVFAGGKTLSDDEMEGLEEILYTSDLGPQTVQQLMSSVQEKLPTSARADFEAVRQALKDEMLEIFSGVKKASELHLQSTPNVWMIVGVNGAGKTTTIGKLAAQLAQSGKKVLVAAGDTFRAAAGSQLRVWTERAQVEIFEPPGVTDPSAVAFDACQTALSRGYDVVIIDTAGRLHTAKNLMDELIKMKRVIAKVIPDAPHEVLIVLDANSGQNALIQAREFNQALSASGVILTKMDGTAKGGVAVGVACELQLPVRLIGVGEKIGDLRPFAAREFVDSIL